MTARRWMKLGDLMRQIEGQQQAQCPTCGRAVASVFDHVDVCPPERPLGADAMLSDIAERLKRLDKGAS